MPHAFSVSAPTKRFIRETYREGEERGKKEKDVEEEREDSNNDNSFGLNGVKRIVRELKNGEKRVYFENAERSRREIILGRLNLLKLEDKTDHKKNGTGRKAKGSGGGDYEDDFEGDAEEEDDYGHDEDFEGVVSPLKKKSKNQNGCQYIQWTLKNRQIALKYLLEVTKDSRQEETLKSLLEKGKTPQAPKFWSAYDTALETKSKIRQDISQFDDEDDEEMQLRHASELKLFWEPLANDMISFFSLEFGGAVGAFKLGDVKYTEIYRDPEDAQDSYRGDEEDQSNHSNVFKYSHTVTNLQPGTSYHFRIRALNGFGSGNYTYKTITTRTIAPKPPRVIKLHPDNVYLRWTFSPGFFRRIEELKHIFTLADAGIISPVLSTLITAHS